MAITNQQVSNAQNQQHAAAHDDSLQVRLIAGPGTGKSFAIQERVLWLLKKGVSPERIFVISFTRASSRDLKTRILEYCEDNQMNADQVSVTTLHSLALRALRAAGRLNYPANPLVMDNWELKNVLDEEFSKSSGYKSGQTGGYTPSRCAEIRGDYEALCNTGQQVPPNYIQPDPPIDNTERSAFNAFRTPRTQLYSCVLPGEIVRECLIHMNAGTLNPATLLAIEHLIVDEYQDLNPVDLAFVDWIIEKGVKTFVAGDDDQSIYSFRYGSPKGIQSFTSKYPGAGDHELTDCFRCTPNVLSAAQALINGNPTPNRIPKNLKSLYEASDPPEQGILHLWRFSTDIPEAKAIAASCKALIADGFEPRQIMILLSNTHIQLRPLEQALERENVEFESPRATSFIDTKAGRFILSLLRIVDKSDDYLAHRTLLGLLPGVGAGTCNQIAEIAIVNNLNFRDLFYNPLLASMFQNRQLTAINRASAISNQVSSWTLNDSLQSHSGEIGNLISQVIGPQNVQEWLDEIANLPSDITMEELRDYIWADTDEQRSSLLDAVYLRLGITPPAGGHLPPSVRIMTMHGAKGLSSGIVFVPGLEDHILPGNRRRPYPGLVMEAARLLYVSITRARAACILSFSARRTVYGQNARRSASSFTAYLGAPFVSRSDGLNPLEVAQVQNSHSNL